MVHNKNARKIVPRFKYRRISKEYNNQDEKMKVGHYSKKEYKRKCRCCNFCFSELLHATRGKLEDLYLLMTCQQKFLDTTYL